MAKKYTEFAELLQGRTTEEGTKGDLYIKIKKNISLKENDTVRLEDPKAKFARMLASGKVDADKIQASMDKIPSFVKKVLVAVQEE